MVRCGVYQIYNTISKKSYIGSSVNIQARVSGHFLLLKKGEHYNKYLQRSYNKNTRDAFIYRDLVVCPRNCRRIFEEMFIILLNPEYNAYPHVDMWELKYHTERTKKKLSEIARKQGRVPTKKALDRSAEVRRVTFPGLVSPDGTVYANIENLPEFCKTHGLPYNQMAKLASKGCKSAHGWTHIDNPNPKRILSQAKKHPSVVSPGGEIFEIFNASKFIRDHGLGMGFYSLLEGKASQYKEWRLLSDTQTFQK